MPKIPENILIVAKAVLPLIFIIGLFVIVGQFGFSKIKEIRNQITTANSVQAVLSQKSDILGNIAVSGTAFSNAAVSALPSTNPALSVTSQIKILASSLGLLVSEVKAGSPTNDPLGFSSVTVSFNVIGPRPQIEIFLKGIGLFAPITNVDRIKISESTPGSALGSITVRSFFAPFPTKIPGTTDAITDLTPEEQTMLKSISTLTQPLFSQIPAASGSGIIDPFGQ